MWFQTESVELRMDLCVTLVLFKCRMHAGEKNLIRQKIVFLYVKYML